jgi:hypothetical protein
MQDFFVCVLSHPQEKTAAVPHEHQQQKQQQPIHHPKDTNPSEKVASKRASKHIWPVHICQAVVMLKRHALRTCTAGQALQADQTHIAQVPPRQVSKVRHCVQPAPQ